MSHAHGGGHPQAQLVMLGLSTAARLIGMRDAQKHAQELAAIEQANTRAMVQELVSKPIEVVREGFQSVLSEIAKRNERLEEERRLYVSERIKCTDSVTKDDYAAEISKINVEVEKNTLLMVDMFGRMADFVELRAGSVARELFKQEIAALPVGRIIEHDG